MGRDYRLAATPLFFFIFIFQFTDLVIQLVVELRVLPYRISYLSTTKDVSKENFTGLSPST